MKMNEYYYKTEFTITNLPYEEDFLDVKVYDCEYLFHSKAYAKYEFERVDLLIQQGLLLRNVVDPSYKKASFNVSLSLVRRTERNEQQYFLQSSKETNQKNQKIEKRLIRTELLKAEKEFKAGYLRHTIPIYDRFFFRTKAHKTESNGPKETEVKEFKLFSGKKTRDYGRFEHALEAAINNFNSLWGSRFDYDGEKGDDIQVQLFLVERKNDVEEEQLLAYKNQRYPLEQPFSLELSEKSYMEYYALQSGQGIKFGIKPILWDKEKIQNYQKAGEADSLKLPEDFYDDLKIHIRIWNAMKFYYMVFQGTDWRNPKNVRTFLHHDLQYIRKDAIDFYEDLIYDQTAGSGSFHNLPKVSLILIRKENNNPLYIKTTDPSKEQFLLSNMREEKELLESLGYSLEEDDDYPHF